MIIQLKLATSAGREDLVKVFALETRRAESATYSVEYTNWKAAIVHEVQAFHVSPTQWKYLEEPFRQLRGAMVSTIADQMNRGRSLRQAVSIAILRVFNASQRLVPVETGDLKASGRINYEGSGGSGRSFGGSISSSRSRGFGGRGFGGGFGGGMGLGLGGGVGGAVGLGGLIGKIKGALGGEQEDQFGSGNSQF